MSGGQTNSQQPSGQDSANPFANTNASTFSLGANEFVPQGVIMATSDEAFPGFSEDAPKKKKNAQPVKKQPEPTQQEKEQEQSSTKGKPKEFFLHNGQLSQEQMVFVYQHYPQYSMNPISIVDWLYREGMRIEAEKLQQQQFENDNYRKPAHAQRGKQN